MKQNHSKLNIFLLSIVSVLVLLILLSNIGQNFKIDITSYNEVVRHYKRMQSYSTKAKNYQSFINYNSNYIRTVLKANKFEPVLKGSYIDSWSKNIPVIEGQSSLEIYDKSNKLIKRYIDKTDFYEDFRGNITSGTVKSKALYKENFESINEVLKEILLFDGYSELKTNEEISDMDTKLKALGASGVISPFHSDKRMSEAGYYLGNLHESQNNKGIAKMLVSTKVFAELNSYTELGYKIRIHSGAGISKIVYKNVHGIIAGKNRAFKPLVINVFYDGPFWMTEKKFIAYKNYLLPSSLVLDCVRVINKQRLRRPDRTIVFNFLCGYSKNMEGLRHYKQSLTDNGFDDKINKGSHLILDGFGLKDSYDIRYGKGSANLAANVSYYMRKSDLLDISRRRDLSVESNMIQTSANEISSLKDINIPNTGLITSSNHFLLSLIQDECYNINLITGNFRQLRIFERNVRSNSAILSIVAITLLAVVLFKPKKLRNLINYK